MKTRNREPSLRVGDAVDKLLDELTAGYARLLSKAYDYRGLAKRFHVPTEQIFLIVGHETAYSLFAKLSLSGQFEAPTVLLGQGDSNESFRLLSLKIVENPPGPADHAMYLFV